MNLGSAPVWPSLSMLQQVREPPVILPEAPLTLRINGLHNIEDSGAWSQTKMHLGHRICKREKILAAVICAGE